MSLILVSEPGRKGGQSAADLNPGTWFFDDIGDIYVIAEDEHSDQKRAVNIGNATGSYIAATPVHDIAVERVIAPGTVFHILERSELGGQDDQ